MNKKGFQGSCHHCGKKGHKQADCFQLKKKNDNEEKGVLMAESVKDTETVSCQVIQDDQYTASKNLITLDGDETIESYINVTKAVKMSWADMCDSSNEDSYDDYANPPDLINTSKKSK
jgi:hypothetical protein